MIDRIGKESSLAREAMRAAQRVVSDRASSVQSGAPGAEAAPTQALDFEGALQSGVREVDRTVNTAESMPIDLLTGRIDDFHEIAVQLKSAELSFKFAMEIRNKLVDAYREIMRMNV